MTKVDQLIEKFKEFKEELNKGVNMSYASAPNTAMSKDATKQYGKAQNATTGTSGGENSIFKNVVPPMMMTEASPAGIDMMAMTEKCSVMKNGQWKLDKVDPTENINIPHPKTKAVMANGVNKQENMKDGTNQRLANPKESPMEDPRGRVHMVKEEGTNEKAAVSKPHNKGKFKVMPEVTEKESKKEKVAGLPYNGDDKKVHKGEKVLVGTGTNDENTGPGRNSGHGAL